MSRGDDCIGVCGPDEGPGVVVVLGEEAVYGGLTILHERMHQIDRFRDDAAD